MSAEKRKRETGDWQKSRVIAPGELNQSATAYLVKLVAYLLAVVCLMASRGETEDL